MDINNTNNDAYLINSSNEQKIELSQNYNLWYVFSVLSWFLFVCCQIESYLSDSNRFNIEFNNLINLYFPILKIFILLLSMSGLIIYLIFTTCKRNQNLYNGMLGGNAKFHFIFFFFASALYIIGQSLKYEIIYIEDNYWNYFPSSFIKKIQTTDLVFSIFTIIILVFSYTQLKLPCEWYIVLSIKKGTFSCFIPYTILKISLDILYLLIIRRDLSENTAKFLIVLFFLSIGVISLAFSFIFKDIIIAFTNIIIYISFIIYYSFIVEEIKGDISMGYIVFLGIIIVGIFLSSFILIGFLVIKHKENIFK